jgi:hypothetical protein
MIVAPAKAGAQVRCSPRSTDPNPGLRRDAEQAAGTCLVLS